MNISTAEGAASDPISPVRRANPRDIPRRSTLLLVSVCAMSAVVYFWWCVQLPVQFNMFADKDDAYFIDAAQLMLGDHWLGNYTQMTLVKGPGFAYFLVLNHLLGTSITVTLTLLFIVSCAVLVRVLCRCVSLPRWFAVGLFVALLFQPALMPSRVIRDSLYHSLFLLTLAGMITLTLDSRRERRFLRCFLCGLPVGLFWITREEGIWVLPAFALLVVLVGWTLRRDRRALLRFGGVLATFAIGASVPVLGTSAMNQHVYGTFTVTDMNAAPFQSTLKVLDSISGGREIPHVPVSRVALREAFDASPAFAELRDNLDDPDNFWLSPGCSVYPRTCDQYAGGWFGWAVRDAAAEAGRYSTASEASTYYDRVATQLTEACEQGVLTCRRSLLPIGPVVSPETLRLLPQTMLSGVTLTTYQADATPPVIMTVGTPERVKRAKDFLGNPRTASATTGAAGIAPEETGRWVQARRGLGSVYGLVTPVVLVLGGLSFGLGVVLLLARRPVRRRALAVAGVCWTLYASRLGLVALIDITSSPGITPLYLEPAFLALYLASVLSMVAVVPSRRAVVSGHADGGARRVRTPVTVDGS